MSIKMTTDMTSNITTLRIDFVSDIACPWCIVGLKSLELALAKLAPTVTADIDFQPFELNPNMPAAGQDITEHTTQKYGISVAQANANRENIRKRGAELGFTFTRADDAGGGRNWVYNTFDAHRLLYWAHSVGKAEQKALKHAMFTALFTDGKNLSDHATLAALCGTVGLDSTRAAAILAGKEYTAEVRAEQRQWLEAGINSVPAVVINQQHLISGGQSPEAFEQALRQIAAAG